MVLNVFYLLCRSLLRSLILTLWLLLSLRFLPNLAPVDPVPFFFFSGSFCCSASLPCSFIGISILCGFFFFFFFFFSSSGPPGSSGVFRFFVAYLFLSSVSGRGGGFWCSSGVRCCPCFSYCLFSFLGYFSFPSFAGGPSPSVVVPAASLP